MANNQAVKQSIDNKNLEFAQKDFELCFEQLRFYDDREISALKYLFSIASGAATVVLGIFEIVKTPTSGFYGFLALLSIVIFLTTLILYFTALQNRIYFVSTASHINKIREHFIGKMFPDDNFYYQPRKALRWTSVHMTIIIGAAILSSLFLGLFVYFFNFTGDHAPSLIASLVAVSIAAFIEIAGGITYLHFQDKKTSKGTKITK